MEKLFGLEMATIAGCLTSALALVVGALALLAWRRPVMFKLGVRPIPRRRAQSTLIVLGLMLATLIITAAFVTGDTLSSTIRSLAIAGLGEMDETIVGGRGLALSDGQRQRLGLARLFLRDPRILVLDEAFSALDLDTEIRIRRNLRRAFSDRTAIVISHRPVGLRETDRVVFLRDGRLAAAAPADLRSLVDAIRDGAPAPSP